MNTRLPFDTSTPSAPSKGPRPTYWRQGAFQSHIFQRAVSASHRGDVGDGCLTLVNTARFMMSTKGG